MTDYIRNMINSLAEDILDIYKIGFRVDDINDLVQKLGGSIQMKKDFSYASLEKNGDGFKIIVSSYQDEQRKRFAIAQELGHLFLHMGYKTNAEIWEKQADKVPFQEKDPEKVRQANEFAAALLMPRYIFFLTLEAASDIAESGKRTIHMQAVADFFNVSLSAAYTRAKIFGII